MARANMPIRPRPPKPEPNANDVTGDHKKSDATTAAISFEVPS